MDNLAALKELNTKIFFYLNNFSFIDSRLDKAISFASQELGIFLIFAAIIFLISHKHPRDGIRNVLVIFFTAILAWGASRAIKYFYPLTRPFEVFDSVKLLFSHGGGDSFPSGHATFFAALATALFAYHKRLGMIYALGALLIGISRIIAGVHFPVDILAGYILGGVIGLTVYKFFNRY